MRFEKKYLQYTPHGYIIRMKYRKGVLKTDQYAVPGSIQRCSAVCAAARKGGKMAEKKKKKKADAVENKKKQTLRQEIETDKLKKTVTEEAAENTEERAVALSAGISGETSEKLLEKAAAENAAEFGAAGCEHCGRTKERSAREYRDLVNRLNRIEGQVRGIRGMLERDAYCPDILIQVAAVNAALNSFNKVLLSNHIKTCVTEHIKEGDDSVVDELVALLPRLMK